MQICGRLRLQPERLNAIALAKCTQHRNSPKLASIFQLRTGLAPKLHTLRGTGDVSCLSVSPLFEAAAPLVPQSSEVFLFFLYHPWATILVAAAAIYVVPRVVKVGVKYLVGPLALALLLYIVITHTSQLLGLVWSVIDFIQEHAVVTSLATAVLLMLMLTPYLLLSAAALALLSFLLSVAVTTMPPVEYSESQSLPASSRLSSQYERQIVKPTAPSVNPIPDVLSIIVRSLLS